jgi:hypothetical protein
MHFSQLSFDFKSLLRYARLSLKLRQNREEWVYAGITEEIYKKHAEMKK